MTELDAWLTAHAGLSGSDLITDFILSYHDFHKNSQNLGLFVWVLGHEGYGVWGFTEVWVIYCIPGR